MSETAASVEQRLQRNIGVCFFSSPLFVGRRNQKASQHCVSAGRRPYEFHRCALDRSLVRRLCREQLSYQFRSVRSEHPGTCGRAHSSRRSHLGSLLAYALLEVPQQGFHLHLACLLGLSTNLSIGDGTYKDEPLDRHASYSARCNLLVLPGAADSGFCSG